MRRCVVMLLAAATLGSAVPVTVADAAPATVLVQGSRGRDVRAVQRKLGLTPDGVYGRQTARAVRAFQRANGLPVTGRVDAGTRAALFAPSAPTTPSALTGGADPAAGAPAPGAASGSALDTMVAAARSVIGKPYRAATSGPDGFDCSGLVIWAAGQAGITGLPRSSFTQYEIGTAVADGDVQAGDLVFFDTAGPGASDVGIASGLDTVISATTHGVREHPLGGSYWGAHYVGARRIG